ncbi:hypothetical protein BDC45DRAFT_536306 [Circinella umbellata]|nr:hypothetical protein BDC45DRAFT_536306 [Circinella umbellata]
MSVNVGVWVMECERRSASEGVKCGRYNEIKEMASKRPLLNLACLMKQDTINKTNGKLYLVEWNSNINRLATFHSNERSPKEHKIKRSTKKKSRLYMKRELNGRTYYCCYGTKKVIKSCLKKVIFDIINVFESLVTVVYFLNKIKISKSDNISKRLFRLIAPTWFYNRVTNINLVFISRSCQSLNFCI